MPKRALKSGTQGTKNKVVKMHIDFTGSNKESILDKGPLDKIPLTMCIHYTGPWNISDSASSSWIFLEEEKIEYIVKLWIHRYHLSFMCPKFGLSL